MAVSSISRRATARPPGLGRLLADGATTMWAHITPWLPTRAGFWAMTVAQPFVLARVRPDGPSRFRFAAH